MRYSELAHAARQDWPWEPRHRCGGDKAAGYSERSRTPRRNLIISPPIRIAITTKTGNTNRRLAVEALESAGKHVIREAAFSTFADVWTREIAAELS
jgi:hypothetical protein